MSVETCIICGEVIPEGRQICPRCEEIFAPTDIVEAMLKQYPVEYEGIKYGCISALTIRTRVSPLIRRTKPYYLEVELMSGRANSVTIADPDKIKILKEFVK